MALVKLTFLICMEGIREIMQGEMKGWGQCAGLRYMENPGLLAILIAAVNISNLKCLTEQARLFAWNQMLCRLCLTYPVTSISFSAAAA